MRRQRTTVVLLCAMAILALAVAAHAGRTGGGLGAAPPADTGVRPEASAPGDLYVVAVGIDQYDCPDIRKLSYGESDAQALADALTRAGEGVFGAVRAQVLLDGWAIGPTVQASIQCVIDRAGPEDTFVFAFVGVSADFRVPDTGASDHYLLLADCDYSADTAGPPSRGALPVGQMVQWLSKARAGHVLVVMDAGGGAVSGFRDITPAGDLVVLGSVGDSTELSDRQHGAVVCALLAGLAGEADIAAPPGAPPAAAGDADMITAGELAAFLPRRLRELTGGQVRAEVSECGDDFVVGAIAVEIEAVRATRAPLRPAEGAQPALTREGRDYALLIATGEYDEWDDLPNPILDAETIGADLEANYGFEVHLVRDPTLDQIHRELRVVAERTYASEDQLLVFIAGHGVYDEVYNEGYVVARDSRRDDPTHTSYLPYAILRQILDNCPCQHVCVVLDVCFGGTFDQRLAERRSRGDPEYQEVTTPEFIARKLRYRTRQYLTSGGKEYVGDGRAGYHSPFAGKFIEALRSFGGDDGVLTMREVYICVEKVKPEPRAGDFGTNEPGSDFIFIAH